MVTPITEKTELSDWCHHLPFEVMSQQTMESSIDLDVLRVREKRRSAKPNPKLQRRIL